MEDPGSGARSHRSLKIVAILAFAAGAAITAGLIVHAGLAAVAAALSALGILGLIIIALAHLPIVALLGAAWWAVARPVERIGLANFIWARAVRDGAAEALPFSQVGGYVIGARALSLSGVEAHSASVSTIVDLAVEFSAKIPYLLLGLVMLEQLTPSKAGGLAIIGIGVCLAISAMLLHPRASTALGGMIGRLMPRWDRLAQSRERILDLLAQMTLRREALLPSALLHFLCWVLGAGETWLIFHLMHAPISLGAALVIDSLVGGLRMVSFFVPASIGIQEGGYVLLCGLFGIPPGMALAFSFARRARDILIAAPVLVSWQGREARALLPGRAESPAKDP
ncbi:MAG TPA: lysylphosphatidylglycerol synthase domain-containing protein [Rhizomicrobium sp.]